MSGPQPVTETVTLYNTLLRLEPSEQAEIGRVVWQLQKLRRAHPADLATLVTLAQALVLQGKPEEAAPIAGDLWYRRQWMDADVLYTYSTLLLSLGDFERVVDITKVALDLAGAPSQQDTFVLLSNSALGSGDIETMRRIAAYDGLRMNDGGSTATPRRDSVVAVSCVLDGLEDIGLLPHLTWHQCIVNGFLRHRITNVDIMVYGRGGNLEIGIHYYMPGTRAERRSLLAEIDTAIEQAAAARGLDAGIFVPTLTVDLLDHVAHPPYVQ